MSWNPDAGSSSAALGLPAEVGTSSAGGKGSTKAAKAKTSKAKKEGEGGGSKKRKSNASRADKVGGAANSTMAGAEFGSSVSNNYPTFDQNEGYPAPPNQTVVGTESSTPSKRKSGAKGAKGKGRGSMRADSRGSRATSARVSMSVAPSQQPGGGQGNNEEEGEFAEGQHQQQQQQQQQQQVEEEEEEEDEEEEEEGGDQGLEEDDWQRQEAIQKARSTAMGPLMKAMDDTQQDRYGVYRRSFLDKRHVKRLVNHLTSQNTTKQVVTLTAALGKIFVGDIVERARRIQQDKGATGALLPEHLLEAHRLYKEEREVPGRLPPGAPSASAGTGGNGKRRRMF